MKRSWLIGFSAVVVVLLTALYFAQAGHAPKGQPALVEINSERLFALQSEFNKAPGFRVVLLLSPT